MPMVEVLGYKQVRSKMSQKRAATLAMLGETYQKFVERARLERQGGAALLITMCGGTDSWRQIQTEARP